jgi:hypothetical protein
MYPDLSGYYTVCSFCKEGKFSFIDDINTAFEEQHIQHGALEIIPAQKFLSNYLDEQYIDIDRPVLKSMNTSIGPSNKQEIIDLFKTSRVMRNKYLQQVAKEEKQNGT